VPPALTTAPVGVTRYTVVGPPQDSEAPGDEGGRPVQERRSVERRLQDAAFVEAVDRAPGVLLVLAGANLLFAVWQGGLQQRPLVLVCAALALVWLLVCQQVQHRLLADAVQRRTTLRRDRNAWLRMMALALLTPALNLAVNLAVASRVEHELTVVLVLVSLYAAAVWAALPVLARMGAWGAGAAALVCAALGEIRLGVTLLVAAVLALWLQRQVAAVWQRATRSRLAADDLSAALASERDAAVRAQQDANRFVATASHDLRQPMHALGLFVSTLERRVRGGTDEALVRNMVRSIDALDQSFGAMLDMSRLDAGSMEANLQYFALRDVFRRLHLHFAGVAEAAGLSLRFSPGGKSVRSDPQLLERVLGNLIQNALRHTREGGVVVVARTRAHQICIEVWDTGSGIGSGELPRIFDEFYQVRDGTRRRQRGLGLGLAIVKRLVRLMGHTLTVASCPGRGTMFRLGVATSDFDEVERVTAAADTVPLPVYAARTILVIDDEDSIRDGLCVVLTEWGYEPHMAATVDEAVGHARRLGDGLDLVVSDLHLADGEDGLDAIARVREVCGSEVPAVVITGDTSADEMRRVMAEGVPLLFKPVQPRKLMSVLRRMSL
jgi:two-component system, sensor histidine kinase